MERVALGAWCIRETKKSFDRNIIVVWPEEAYVFDKTVKRWCLQVYDVGDNPPLWGVEVVTAICNGRPCADKVCF